MRFLEADILRLPFETGSFDVVSIAFGIRNIPDLPAAVREMARVLKPGGRLMILEFGRPSNPWALKLVNAYFRVFVSGVSGAFTGNRAAYRYLEDSTARFNLGERVLEACQSSGRFTNIDILPLAAGMVYLYKATAN